MTRTAAWRLAWGSFLLTVAALAATLSFGLAAHHIRNAVAYTPVLLSFATVGLIVAGRRPANPIGWLFLVGGLGSSLGLAGTTYAEYATQSGATPAIAGWTAWVGAISIELYFPLLLALLLFPDGQLPSPRWRWVAWLTIGANGLILIAAATSNIAFKGTAPAGLRDPLRLIPDSLAGPLVDNLQVALLFLFVLSAAGCVVRYRRSAGDERQQIKWFAYAGILAALGFFVLAIVANDPAKAFIVLVPLVPIAAGIAIMKYRLYDIDVVINKTLVYGSLAAFITGVYVVIVAGIGSLGAGRLLGQGPRPSLGLSIVATAVVAVAFQPLRERMQHVANRLVYGKRATPYEVLSEFSGRMGESYATEDLLPRMAQILADGTAAVRADVWLKDASELRPAAWWPPAAERPSRVACEDDAAPAVEGADRVTPVRHQGEFLGALSVTKRPGERLTPTDDKLISDLAAQAGLVLRNVGLTEQLLARLKELRASRQRIVAAQDDERRRIERNIHDGAQRQLVALAAKLGLAESMTGRDEERQRALVGQLKAEVHEALQTLRDLAHGIYPPLLADQGLAAAVRTHASKALIPVELDVGGIGRYPEEIEAAAYFCCVEALHNARRHASASTVRIHLSRSNGELAFAVEDDGRGFDRDATAFGSGLQTMSDRLAALGGTLEIDARPGSGTRVAGRIPIPG